MKLEKEGKENKRRGEGGGEKRRRGGGKRKKCDQNETRMTKGTCGEPEPLASQRRGARAAVRRRRRQRPQTTH